MDMVKEISPASREKTEKDILAIFDEIEKLPQSDEFKAELEKDVETYWIKNIVE